MGLLDPVARVGAPGHLPHGRPRPAASWRHLNGYGSHTYLWTNAAGEKFWVKYHFISRQGVEVPSTTTRPRRSPEPDADYYRRDLYEAIERGDNPVWDIYVQVMPYDDAKTYRFNPFDLTKVWPHTDYPRINFGHFTLNRNPKNHFAEIEQIALSPANQVPGTGISPDKMLMARVFSYPDAQRYRMGTNYQSAAGEPAARRRGAQLLAGRLAAPPLQRGRRTATTRRTRSAAPSPTRPAAQDGAWESDGELVRTAATLHSEDSDFGQPGTLYREVYDDGAKARLLETLTGQGQSITIDEIRERFFQYWTNVDAELGAKLRAAVAA